MKLPSHHNDPSPDPAMSGAKPGCAEHIVSFAASDCVDRYGEKSADRPALVIGDRTSRAHTCSAAIADGLS